MNDLNLTKRKMMNFFASQYRLNNGKCWLLLCCLFSFNYICGDDDGIKVTLNDKRVIKGEVKSIDQKGVVLETGELFKNDEVQEVLYRAKSDNNNTAVLLLNNESILYFNEFQFLDNKVSFNFLNETIELPFPIVKGLVYKSTSSENTKIWKKHLAIEVRKADIVFVLKDDKLIPIEGVIKEIEKDKVKITWDGKEKTISIEKIVSILFASPTEKIVSNFEVQTIDGSKIYCASININNDLCKIGFLQEEENLQFSCSKISRVLFNNRKFIYLSTLEPLEISTEKILIDVSSYWEKDQSIWKKTLSIGSKTYTKGVGVHAYCKLKYKVPEGSLQFITEFGIDNEVVNKAGCVFKILVDSKVFLDEVVTSIDGAKSIKIELPIKSEEITLIVEPGPNLDIGDHGVWGNARFIKN